MTTVLDRRHPQRRPEDFIATPKKEANPPIRRVLPPRQRQLEALLTMLELGEGDATPWLKGLEELNLSADELSRYDDALKEAVELGFQARIAADKAALAEDREAGHAMGLLEGLAASPRLGHLVDMSALGSHLLEKTSNLLEEKERRLRFVSGRTSMQQMADLAMEGVMGQSGRFEERLAHVCSLAREEGYALQGTSFEQAWTAHHTALLLERDVQAFQQKRIWLGQGLAALTSTGLCPPREADGLALDALASWVEAARSTRKGDCTERCGTCKFRPELAQSACAETLTL